MSYEKKFRQRALEYWAAGHTKSETAAVFGVGTSTLQTWKSQLNQKGNLAPKVRETPWRKIDPDKQAWCSCLVNNTVNKDIVSGKDFSAHGSPAALKCRYIKGFQPA